MKQKISFDFERDIMSYDEIDKIVERARAQRDVAFGRSIRSSILGIAKGFRRFFRAIDEAGRLSALAMMNERQLAAIGLNRQNLTAMVYGWKPVIEMEPEKTSKTTDIKFSPIPPDRIAA